MRAARFCSFCRDFAAIPPDNTTIIEMGLSQGIEDVMQYSWRNKIFRFMAPMPEAIFLDSLSI